MPPNTPGLKSCTRDVLVAADLSLGDQKGLPRSRRRYGGLTPLCTSWPSAPRFLRWDVPPISKEHSVEGH